MGCTSTKRTEQVLEAMKWRFGERTCRSFKFADDAAGDQAGSYFDFSILDELYVETEYRAWMSDGVAVAPASGGKTLIEISYTSNDDAATQTGLAETAIEAQLLADHTNSVARLTTTTDTIEMENLFLGATKEDSTNSGDIVVTINKNGFGGDIGAIAQGGGSLSTSQELEDIKSDSTGEIVLDQIMKGSSVSLDITLAEMSKENWENLVGEGYGDKEVIGLDTITGFGTSKLYKSAFDFSGMLVGHPIRKDSSDRSADIVLWKCLGNLNSIQYSGSEVQGGEFSFTALKDGTKPSSIDLFARGDHTLV